MYNIYAQITLLQLYAQTATKYNIYAQITTICTNYNYMHQTQKLQVHTAIFSRNYYFLVLCEGELQYIIQGPSTLKCRSHSH